jgi:Lipopolysaccharide-assembly
MNPDRRSLLLLGLAAVGLPGCGYALSGRGTFLPASIKTIGVPLFTNTTNLFEIEQKVTDRVRAELIGRGRWTVKPESDGVDGLLTGQIAAATLTPAAFNQQQQATRQVLTLVARIELRDVAANKVIWSNPSMQFSEQYEVSTASSALDPNAFLRQDVNALDRLASEFARAVVSAMLEAF